MKPIIEVKEDPEGSMSIFDNDEELYEGKLVCIRINQSGYAFNPQFLSH